MQFPRVVLDGVLTLSDSKRVLYKELEDPSARPDAYRDAYQMRFTEAAGPVTRPSQPLISGWTRAMLLVALAWAFVFYFFRFVFMYIYLHVRHAFETEASASRSTHPVQSFTGSPQGSSTGRQVAAASITERRPLADSASQATAGSVVSNAGTEAPPQQRAV